MKYKAAFLIFIGMGTFGLLISRNAERMNGALINTKGSTILERFKAPRGWDRVHCDSNSFGYYLRHLALKAYGEKVHYYDHSTKDQADVYVSVVDMDIDASDLQQCADAVMRLRGEYLFVQQKFDQIHFNYLSDGKPRFFTTYAKGNYSYQNFRKYMRGVFAYANTGSLHDEMASVSSIKDMKVGDVFIQKRQPFGHAVVVVDMIEHKATKRKMFLLAQSYMPAQETQILMNPDHSEISPWYALEEGMIVTPEWTFKSGDLRRFK
ncbi:MAG TPA: DUF4846 domain-containing protein [Cytophagales bacterium]|nr:DUF4846 domain-containing protein [Cytophagales bacterium]